VTRRPRPVGSSTSVADGCVEPRLGRACALGSAGHAAAHRRCRGAQRGVPFGRSPGRSGAGSDRPIQLPEPLGLVLAEAIACETPVIARPVGAAIELIDEGVTGPVRSSLDELAEVVALAADAQPRSAANASTSTSRPDHGDPGRAHLRTRHPRALTSVPPWTHCHGSAHAAPLAVAASTARRPNRRRGHHADRFPTPSALAIEQRDRG
jgi:hypothetical protein